MPRLAPSFRCPPVWETRKRRREKRRNGNARSRRLATLQRKSHAKAYHTHQSGVALCHFSRFGWCVYEGVQKVLTYSNLRALARIFIRKTGSRIIMHNGCTATSPLTFVRNSITRRRSLLVRIRLPHVYRGGELSQLDRARSMTEHALGQTMFRLNTEIDQATERIIFSCQNWGDPERPLW